MMLKLRKVVLLALVFLHAPFCLAQASAPDLPGDQAIVARLDTALAKHFPATEPGATVIVVKNGETLFRKAYGMADFAQQLPMHADMSLRLGSITKQFTATGILMLADEGKLALTDDMRKYLPDYPVQSKKITIEHLLSHTSGILSYTSKPDYFANSNRDVSVTDMIASFKDEPVQFEPGSRWDYSNSGYFLLGAIIEKISGMPYADFVAQRIFVPLGMTQTAYEGNERLPPSRALGHARRWSKVVPSAPLSLTQPFAAGALVSTVDDLARWDAAIANGALLKPLTWTQAFTTFRLNDGSLTKYGYGWEVGKLLGKTLISHGGGIHGFTSFALRMPEEKLFIAVLSNVEGSNSAETAAVQMASIVLRK